MIDKPQSEFEPTEAASSGSYVPGRFTLGAKHFSAAFLRASVGMVITDLNGDFVLVNEAFVKLTGYSADELYTMNCKGILHPEDLKGSEERQACIPEGSSSFETVERYIHKDGRLIWVRKFATIVRDEDTGDVVVSILEDITDEKKAREQERRMHFLIDNSSDYISLTDATEQLIYLNRAGREMVGIPADAVDLGISADFAAPDEVLRVRREVLPEIQRQGYWEGQLSLRHLITGEEIPVHVKSLVITDSYTGAHAGRATVVHDLRPELAARAAIQLREEHLQRAVDLARLGTWTIDLAKREVSYSARVGEIYGLPEGPVSLDDMPGVHPDDAARVAADLERAVKIGAHGIYDNEHRTLDKHTGRIRFVHSVGKVICNNAGEPYVVMGTLQDITEQKLARQGLELQVAERTSELHNANIQLQDVNSFLQQSNAELEQYAYIASHDLQEPLRKISVFAGMLGKMEGMPQQALAMVEKINQASSRMTQLIRDLLDFSRLLKAERIMRPLDLNAVLRVVLNDFDLQIAEKGAVIEADRLPTIEAIGLQMNQLFYNLIGNALKFVREGVPPQIHIRCRKLDEGENAVHGLHDNRVVYYFITVSDNGIGFNSQYAEQIFEVFKRLHTRHAYPGSGIGLAICRRILQNHGGIMTARSDEGAGTTISMILPSRQIVSSESDTQTPV